MKYNNRIKTPIFVRPVAILLLMVCHLVAEPSQSEQLISTSFKCISMEGEISDIGFTSDGKIQQLYIYPGTRTRLFSYYGPPKIDFVRPGTDDEPPTLLASTTLSGDFDRYLLIFAKSSSNSGKFNILALPEDTSSFRPGSYRFINFCPFKIALKLGDEEYILSEQDVTDIGGEYVHGNYYQAIFISLPDGQSPVPAYSGRIYFNDKMRMLYIITPKAGGGEGQVSLIGIPERMTRKD